MPPETTRVALVTGSSSGIGAEIARRLASEGCHVVVNSRSSVEAGESVAAEIGGSYLQADVGDETAARSLIERVVERHGRLDVLINNAGTTEVIDHRDLAAATPQVWRRLYDVNVIAPFVLVTAAEAALRAAAPGCVVNVSSLAGVRPTGSSIPYAASKAALNHQTVLLAKALGPDIRVNAVAPGLVDTPWTADWDACAGSCRRPRRCGGRRRPPMSPRSCWVWCARRTSPARSSSSTAGSASCRNQIGPQSLGNRV